MAEFTFPAMNIPGLSGRSVQRGIQGHLITLPTAGLLFVNGPLRRGILVFATSGNHSLNNSVFDVGFMYLTGVIGFFIFRVNISIAPAVIGMILKPMVEQQFRLALAVSQGDPSIFFNKPISATLLVLAVMVLIAVPTFRLVRNME